MAFPISQASSDPRGLSFEYVELTPSFFDDFRETMGFSTDFSMFTL